LALNKLKTQHYGIKHKVFLEATLTLDHWLACVSSEWK